MSKIDIIFSITVHESISSLKDLICNLKYFCKLQIKVVLHCSNSIYKECCETFINDESILITKIHWDKSIESMDILKAHFDNYDTVKDIDFDYFIILASNCLMIRNLTKKDLDSKNVFSYDLSHKNQNYNEWQYPKFFWHKTLVKKFTDHKIDIIGCQHEGAVMKKNQMKQCRDFFVDNSIYFDMKINLPFEEIILPSLEKHFSEDGKIYRIIHIFWNLKDYRPLIGDIENIYIEKPNTYGVKRVFRDYDDNVRKELRERNNKYQN